MDCKKLYRRMGRFECSAAKAVYGPKNSPLKSKNANEGAHLEGVLPTLPLNEWKRIKYV